MTTDSVKAQIIIPPVVYIPVVPDKMVDRLSGDGFKPRLGLVNDGRRVLLAYSALDRLFAGVGEQQEWVLIRTEELEGLRHRWGIDTVTLDTVLPEDLRQIVEPVSEDS